MTDTKTPRRSLLIPGLVIVCCVAAMAGAGWFVHQLRRLHTVPGSPRETFLAESTAGPAMVMVDAVEVTLSLRKTRSAYRVAAVDVATGRLLGHQLFDTKVECAAARGGRLWCVDKQIAATSLDLATMAIAGRADVLLAKAGLTTALAPGRALVRQGDLYVLFVDGKSARIDSATLAVQDDPGLWPKREYPPPVLLRLGDAALQFGPGPRHALYRIDPRTPDAPPPPEAPTFLSEFPSPMFFRPLPDVLLIDQVTSLDPGTAHRQLMRVDSTPRVIWTVELPSKLPPVVLGVGDTILFGTSDPTLRALAVDAATGLERWRFAF